MSVVINENFWFGAKENLSISLIDKGLSIYSDNVENEKKLESNTVIFLDTNVLTYYYKISFSEREKLRSVLEKYKNRIILTRQVEKEFIKNRTGIIRKFNGKLKESLIEKFKTVNKSFSDIRDGKIKGVPEYINDKVIKNDFPDLSKNLSKIYDDFIEKVAQAYQELEIEKLIKIEENKINNIIESATRENNAHEKNDKILNLLADIKICENLSSSEIDFLKRKYNELKEIYKTVKSNDTINWQFAFPGCGEKKDKEDPTGDFIIFHEVLKYMKENECNAIFLTNDVTKKDWLNSNKEQYTHYIESAYSNTNQMVYIFHAQDILGVSYKDVFDDPPLPKKSIKKISKKPLTKSRWWQKRNSENNRNELITDLESEVIYVIANNQDTPYAPANAWDVERELTNLGFRKVAINIIMRSLVDKNIIVIVEDEDFNGNTFSVYKFTDNGEKFIIDNFKESEAKIIEETISQSIPEDNLPF